MGEAVVRTQRMADGSVTVEVRGPLEAETVGALHSVVLDAVRAWHPSRLVIDLRNVPFMDSIGVGTLVAGNNAMREVGGTLELRSPSPFVHRLLHITGLTDFFGLPPMPESEPRSSATSDRP